MALNDTVFDLNRIHTFEVLGKRFVYDINSAHCFEIDGLTCDILNTSEAGGPEEIVSKLSHVYGREKVALALSELLQLSTEGDLFSKEETTNITGDDVVEFLILHVTRDCNLRCRYCFQGNDAYRSKRQPMSKDIGVKAIELLIGQSEGRKRTAIGFSGGEPLLNFDLIRHLVQYARARSVELGREFDFQITTNGVLLTEDVVAFLDDNDFRVDISIDGSRELHDEVRTFPGEERSFDIVFGNALRLLERRIGKRTTVQMVLSRSNLNLFEELLTLFGYGFPRIVVNPVVLPGRNDLSIRASDLAGMRSSYDSFVESYVKLIRQGASPQFANLVEIMKMLHFGQVKNCLCGAGVKRIVVSPDGVVYPCHMLDDAEDYRMGSVFDGLDERTQSAWAQSRNIGTIEECRSCWARYLCGGGCRAIGYCLERKLRQPLFPFCEFKKMDIERAVYAYSELGETTFNRLLA